jgi:seryl-tRNA(Sec) selenium transferase
MIIVHEIFVCKPGNASKAAKMFKQAMAGSKELVNVMTDITGQYHRVIMVSKYQNLAAFEKALEKYKNPTKEMKKAMGIMHEFQNMYLTGSREIYKAW